MRILIFVRKNKKKSREPAQEEEGHGKKKEERKDKATQAMNQGILPSYKNKAELSLSIKGNKQDSSLVCLKINNYKEIKQNLEGVKDSLHKIIKVANHTKAYIYEANENIFLINKLFI